MEFARASYKGPRLAPCIGAARLAPCPNTLFGPLCAAYSGLVAFLQRLGLEVVPVDNDPNGGDRTHDILCNEFCSNLLHRSGENSSQYGRLRLAQHYSQSAGSYHREHPAAAHLSFVVDKKGK